VTDEMKNHKIVKIVDRAHVGKARVYKLQMDCHVQPFKLVVCKEALKLKEGAVFDPHFSNQDMIARFPPTEIGFVLALRIAREYTCYIVNTRPAARRGFH